MLIAGYFLALAIQTIQLMRNIILFIVLSIIQINNVQAKDIKRELDSVVSSWERLAKISGSVVVLQHGKVLLNKGYGVIRANSGTPPTENTLYVLGESTEMFTATLIFKLVEDKKISLQDTITKYLPELPEYRKVTIKDLLTHRSGIDDYFTNPKLMERNTMSTRTKTQIMNIITSMPLRFEPGSSHYYSFSNYYILGLIIERVAKMPYYDAIQQYILRPVGIRDAGFDFNGLPSWDKAQGYSILNFTRMIPAVAMDSTITASAAGLYMSPNSMYKWANAMLENNILKKNSWQVMTNASGNNFLHGWEQRDFYGKRAIGHNGEVPGFVNHFYVVPEDSTIIIIMSNDFESETVKIMNDLVAALYDKPYTLPQPKVSVFLEPKRLEFYTGIYSSEGIDMNIYIDQGQLWSKIDNQQEVTLVADAKPDEFFMNGKDMEFKFFRDKNNQITHMVVRYNRREQTWKRTQR